MKNRLTLAILVTLIGTGAFAHSETKSTTPSNGAVLEVFPETIELSFSDGMRLTKVEVIDASSNPQILELEGQSGFAKEFSLPVAPMGTGNYQIEWRGLGVDGHPMNGTFSFEVN